MEKDGKTSYHKNPWMVDSIKDFWFLNCPECKFKSKEEINFQKHAIEEHPFCKALFKDSNLIEIDPQKINSTVVYDIDSMSELSAFRQKDRFEEMSIEDLKAGTLDFELVEQVNLSVNIVKFSGKSFSEALILVSTNPQYDKMLFIELQVQNMKIPSSNLGRTCCVQKLFLTFRTIMHTTCSPPVLQKEELLTKIYLY